MHDGAQCLGGLPSSRRCRDATTRSNFAVSRGPRNTTAPPQEPR